MTLATRPMISTRSLAISSPLRAHRQLAHAIIVHPIAVIRAGLGAVLGSGTVGQVSSSTTTFDALRIAVVHPPQIVLFDFESGHGPEASRLFAGLWPRPVLVALVGPGSATSARECLAAGVDAAIAIEGATRESILDCLQHVIDGKGPVTSGFRGEQTDAGTVAVDEQPTACLTPREREMLYLIGEGLSNREIAEVLGLSVKTIEAHRGNVSRKLNIRSRSGLMRIAMGVPVA